eukprot:43737-Chlamydomonas_euryale.AAC.2
MHNCSRQACVLDRSSALGARRQLWGSDAPCRLSMAAVVMEWEGSGEEIGGGGRVARDVRTEGLRRLGRMDTLPNRTGRPRRSGEKQHLTAAMLLRG